MKTEKKINKLVWILNHDVRKAVANMISLSVVLEEEEMSQLSKKSICHLLQKALDDIDAITRDMGY